MRRPDKEPDEPLLFDLPLAQPERGDSAAAGRRQARERPERPAAGSSPAAAAGTPSSPGGPRRDRGPRSQHDLRDLRESAHQAPDTSSPAAVPAQAARSSAVADPAADPAAAPQVTLGRRLLAGAADLLIHAAVLLVVLAGTRFLGVRPILADWPAAVVFTLAFSFLYVVVPLAFWGHSVGMAWAGLVSHNEGGEPLTFDQTARRWLAALLTAATLGLALLATGSRRSLADRLSGSLTRRTS
ncbi:MAG TPA: RDD family protein [Thermoanaerobaculia bacterium]|nr:RDD family protein [Thermoanaerobaculia bacterium]